MSAAGSSLRKATLSLIGTIIGAGIFGLPLVFSRVGILAGSLIFWLIAFLTLATHLLFAEIVLSHREKMRLPGYAHRELGRVGFIVATVAYPLQLVGSNLIYLILGAEFLAALFEPALGLTAPSVLWLALFFALGALVVRFGLKFFAAVESAATWILVAAIVVVVLVLLEKGSFGLPPTERWDLFLAPFGIFLFALSGVPAIVEIVEIAGRSRSRSNAAIILGTLVAAMLSWLFGVSLALAAGGQPLKNLTDILSVLPAGWQWLLPVVGFLAVITSYFVFSETLQNTLRLDFKVPPTAAWAASMFGPFFLAFVINRDFLSLVNLVGTFFGGLSGALIGLIGYSLLRRRDDWTRHLAYPVLLSAAFYLFGMATRLIIPEL